MASSRFVKLCTHTQVQTFHQIGSFFSLCQNFIHMRSETFKPSSPQHYSNDESDSTFSTRSHDAIDCCCLTHPSCARRPPPPVQSNLGSQTHMRMQRPTASVAPANPAAHLPPVPCPAATHLARLMWPTCPGADPRIQGPPHARRFRPTLERRLTIRYSPELLPSDLIYQPRSATFSQLPSQLLFPCLRHSSTITHIPSSTAMHNTLLASQF